MINNNLYLNQNVKEHALIKLFLKERSLVESNIVSFNDFIERRLQQIVNMLNEEIQRDEVDLWLGKIRVGRPQIIESDGSEKPILPIEARLRKITYAAPVYLEVSLGKKEYSEVEMGKLPIMIKSKFCNLNGKSKEEIISNYEDPADPGGYFIINGNERVLTMIEDLAQNQAFVENGAKGLMLRLFSQRGSYRIPIAITESPDGILYISFSRFKNVPIVVMAKALGLTKDSEIAALIGKDSDTVIVNLYEYARIQSQEDALNYIAEKMALQGTPKEILDRVKSRIDSTFLPHIGTKSDSRKEKAVTLIKLVKQFLISKELKLNSDKDHYANKRVRMSGDLLADLFRVNLTIFVRDLQHNLQKIAKKKKFYSIKSIAKSTLFSHRIESAFATGSWVGEKKGITQNMDKTNCLSVLSQLQRVTSLLLSEQENFKARTLHPTHYGRFCPTETPEGTPIGLRKNLSMLVKISTIPNKTDEEIALSLEKIGLKRIKIS